MSRITIENEMERAIDSRRYRDRSDLLIANANMFIANNNNPFLVSPYAPPTNVAKATAVQAISSIIANLIAGLSTVIDLATFTLSISTIEPVVTDPSQTLTLNGEHINMNASDDININAVNNITFTTSVLNVDSAITNFQYDTYFNNISTGYIFASNAEVSTLAVSSLLVDNETVNNFTVNSTLSASTITATNINFTTLLGDSMTTNFLTVNSTIDASTITATNINFTTLQGDSMTTNFLTVNSTLAVSTLNAASSVITKELTFSSIFMNPGYLSTTVSPFNSSFIISIGGVLFKIPLELA